MPPTNIRYSKEFSPLHLGKRLVESTLHSYMKADTEQ